jgi:hypothetical protein
MVDFKMSRNILKCTDAWEEYRYGRLSPNTGQRTISIKELDSRWGSKGRGPKSSTEGTFYRRREALWIFVLKVLEQNPTMSETLLIQKLELAQGKKSLRNFCKCLHDILEKAGETNLLEYERTSGDNVI